MSKNFPPEPWDKLMPNNYWIRLPPHQLWKWIEVVAAANTSPTDDTGVPLNLAIPVILNWLDEAEIDLSAEHYLPFVKWCISRLEPSAR